MACIYTYKGKQYSEQEIKDIVFKEKVKPEDIKFATLDDIANILAYSNSKIILDGWKVEYSTPLGNKYDTLEEVNDEIRNLAGNILEPIQLTQEQEQTIDKIWKKYPKLKEIFKGNKSLYQQYLDNIYPNANEEFKGKLFFHGTKNPIEGGKFKISDRNLAKGLWFTKQLGYAKRIESYKNEGDSPTTYGVILNISNPKHFYNSSGALLVQRPSDFEKEYDRKNNDAAVFHHPESSDGKFTNEGGYNQVVVFDESQIHIIGDSNDVNLAKKFVKNNVEVDLSGVKVNRYSINIDRNNLPSDFIDNFKVIDNQDGTYNIINSNPWVYQTELDTSLQYSSKKEAEEIAFKENKSFYEKEVKGNIIEGFIEKNKEYEQSKEIVEEYKKINNIQYDPEEVYSRGQEFYHIHNAYSRNNVDTELWIQNLLETIQDKAKIGAKVEMSFATAPKGEVGKGLQHHNKKTKQTVYITSYPKSEDIEFVSQIDNHTSSFTDLTVDMIKAFTNQKNERVGITLTKSVPLRNLNTIQPNLATAVDDVAHHNEIVIGLTPSNFRINYEEEVPYHLKKIIDNFNKILDDKYGKLVKPEIKTPKSNVKITPKLNALAGTNGSIHSQKQKNGDIMLGISYWDKEGTSFRSFPEYGVFNTFNDAQKKLKEVEKEIYDKIINEQGKQPTQTRSNTTSIESVKDKLNIDPYEDFKFYPTKIEEFKNDFTGEDVFAIEIGSDEFGEPAYEYYKTKQEAELALDEKKKPKQKEYTNQALINLKVAALKEVARKYPRSLITSKVVPINPNMVDNSEIQYSKRESNSNTIDRLATSYSQIFEDENTDLDNVLKEKKLLEYLNKQIKYIDEEGNECAEFGLKTGVSGTNWRIEENLNWGKKHSEGGIDLTMTDDGIVFRRNNSDIKASHGLVIKAEDGIVMPDESNIDGEDPKNPPKYPKSIKIKDGRVKNPITGKPFNGNKSGDYDYLLMHEVVHNAKKYGIDPYNFLAMAMQETTLGKAGGGMTNPFHILNSSTIESKMDKKRYSEYFKNKTDRMRPVEMAANFYKNVKLLDKPKKKNPNIQDDIWDLQSWNGYGSIYPTTEQHIDGGGDRYGVSIPKEGINMSKNPMYGIWVKDLSNIFRDSKEVNDLVTRIYGPNAPAPYPDRIINDDVSE